MKRSEALADKTARYVILHGGWRVVLACVTIVMPIYVWILFYYLSTGAWHQSSELVRMNAPLLVTFLLPLLAGTWLLGFRGWRAIISAIAAAVVTGWLPAHTVATRLLPGSYINLAIVLTLLAICLQSFRYWRDHAVHNLPAARYTRGAVAVTVTLTLMLSVLLWPLVA